MSTVPCDGSVTSAGNATIETLQVYQIDDDFPANYRGPKVLPKNETPATICTANTIGLVRSRKLFRVLLDSGSNACLIKRSALPAGIKPKFLNDKRSFRTLAGTLQADQIVTMRDIRLPEFNRSATIAQQRALIFDNTNCKYDLNLGIQASQEVKSYTTIMLAKKFFFFFFFLFLLVPFMNLSQKGGVFFRELCT